MTQSTQFLKREIFTYKQKTIKLEHKINSILYSYVVDQTFNGLIN